MVLKYIYRIGIQPFSDDEGIHVKNGTAIRLYAIEQL
jgi:hypothetical protein